MSQKKHKDEGKQSKYLDMVAEDYFKHYNPNKYPLDIITKVVHNMHKEYGNAFINTIPEGDRATYSAANWTTGMPPEGYPVWSYVPSARGMFDQNKHKYVGNKHVIRDYQSGGADPDTVNIYPNWHDYNAEFGAHGGMSLTRPGITPIERDTILRKLTHDMAIHGDEKKSIVTDEYLNSGVYSDRVSSQPLDPNKTEKLEEHLTHVSEDPPSNETRWQQLFEKTLLDEMNKE